VRAQRARRPLPMIPASRTAKTPKSFFTRLNTRRDLSGRWFGIRYLPHWKNCCRSHAFCGHVI
jgi:hypothetical protein